MDTFDKALQLILSFEGGYVNNPYDKGGATNKGIIQTTYDSYRLSKQLPKASVKNITDQEIADIYYTRYWLPSGSDRMPAQLAFVVFDTSVNMGISKAIGYLQELLGSKQRTWNAALENDLKFYLTKHSVEDLVAAFLQRRVQSYRAYATRGNQRVFLQGWLNRVEHVRDVLKERDTWV